MKFCHSIGLDYVSCSPYRVPIARLAAAHAALESSPSTPSARVVTTRRCRNLPLLESHRRTSGRCASPWSPSTTIRTWAAFASTCISSPARPAAAVTMSTSSRRTFPAPSRSRTSFGSAAASRCTPTARRRASPLGWNLRRDMRRVLRRGTVRHRARALAAHAGRSRSSRSRKPSVRSSARSTRTSIGRSATRSAGASSRSGSTCCSAAIAVSHSTTVALNRYFEADWQIIPNGIDTDVFHPSAPPPPGITNDVPTILFLGRFDPRNGLTTLIDSFRRVKGRKATADAKRGSSSSATDRFASTTTSRRTATRTSSSSAPCSKAGRATTRTARCTPAPRPKRRSASRCSNRWRARRPSSARDILGFRDVVVDGREALMVPCGDRDALADALVRVLDDEGLAIQLGTTGRQNSLEYSWARVTSRVLDVYQNVLGTSRRRRYDRSALGAGAVVIGGAAHGAFHRNSPLFGRPIRRLATTTAPSRSPSTTARIPTRRPSILDALAERGVKATFFILGRHAERWPELVARVAGGGARDRQPRLLPPEASLQVAGVRTA